jgi:hypothetical protein
MPLKRRSIREEDVGDMLDLDKAEKPDPDELARRGDDLANRLDSLRKQVEVHGQPATTTDFELLGMAADCLRELCQLTRGDTPEQEARRLPKSGKELVEYCNRDERAAINRGKRLAEFLQE